jgi:hypothetical protein
MPPVLMFLDEVVSLLQARADNPINDKHAKRLNMEYLAQERRVLLQLRRRRGLLPIKLRAEIAYT